jgi:hypothetical protein
MTFNFVEQFSDLLIEKIGFPPNIRVYAVSYDLHGPSHMTERSGFDISTAVKMYVESGFLGYDIL